MKKKQFIFLGIIFLFPVILNAQQKDTTEKDYWHNLVNNDSEYKNSSLTVIHTPMNPVYKIMKQRGWISPIENNLGKLTSDQLAKGMVTSMGYNDTTLLLLKKDGVNMLELNKQKLPWNDKILAAISDCIIIGTIAKIEYPFGGAHSWFHTVAYVQVEKYLRNDYNLPIMQIPIFIASGPNGKGEEVRVIGEETLDLGEHVLLYLSASELISFASDNHDTDLYKKLINDSRINFEMMGKYDIQDGELIGKQRVGNLANVKSEIEKVVTIINRKRS